MTESIVIENLYSEERYAFPAPVLVVLSDDWQDLSAEEKTVLARMLNAVKLTLDSVQILSLKEFSLEDLAASAPSKVLALGATCSSIDKTYQLVTHSNVQVIVADSLKALDDVRKKNLWQALRVMFGV